MIVRSGGFRTGTLVIIRSEDFRTGTLLKVEFNEN